MWILSVPESSRDEYPLLLSVIYTLSNIFVQKVCQNNLKIDLFISTSVSNA